MSDPSITLKGATQEDLDRIVDLLEEHDLPFDDVRSEPRCFLLASSGSTFVGIAGLETFGAVGLLRSVVVVGPRRGRGYGSALIDAVEDHARTNQVGTLYLLTTTAAEFFRQVGYTEVPRESVPPDIAETPEFTDLCPATATCMWKDVGPGTKG